MVSELVIEQKKCLRNFIHAIGDLNHGCMSIYAHIHCKISMSEID